MAGAITRTDAELNHLIQAGFSVEQAAALLRVRARAFGVPDPTADLRAFDLPAAPEVERPRIRIWPWALGFVGLEVLALVGVLLASTWRAP